MKTLGRTLPDRLTVLSFALVLGLAGCQEGSSPTEVNSFPRAFTSQSASCLERQSVRMVAPGLFETTTQLQLEESSTEALFAGHAVIQIYQVFDINGELVNADIVGLYTPTAVDGTWSVVLTDTGDASFSATGTGDGALAGRTIDFEMQPLTGNCGFASSGTIR